MASIRPRRASDLQACVEVMKAVYADSGYPVEGVENAVEALQTDEMAWVAEDSDSGSGSDGAVIGHVAMKRASETDSYVALWRERHLAVHSKSINSGGDANIAVLGRLFIHPRARRRGLGTRLVRVVEDEARRRGCRLLILALVKDQDAIRLYRRLGWEYYGSTVYCWGEGSAMEAECFASPLLPAVAGGEGEHGA